MILPLALAALTFVVLLAILRPLIQGEASAKDGAALDRAVYRDQLLELDRDIERGLLSATEAASVRLEIQRRLLGVAPEATPVRGGRARWLAAITAIVTAGGAATLYVILGLPVTPTPSGPEALVIAGLTDRVRAHPDDAEAWTLYARAVSRMDRWDDAETAWRKVIALGHPSPEAVAALGEIMVLRQNGSVGQDARGMFDMALRGDPKNDIARYYLALAAAQDGDAASALTQWQALLDDMGPESPGRTDVQRQMADTARRSGLPMPASAGPGPDIQAMVAKLAARLAEHPDDEAGWERLGRSYMVLGQSQGAAEAYEKAAALKPSDPTLKVQAAEAMLVGLKPDDALPARAITLLRQAESSLPADPGILWYLGLDAARGHDAAHARDYWTRLVKVLPPDGDDIKMVRQALESLDPRR